MTDDAGALAAEALRCSFAAEARGDPLLGTAAPAAGFLLIEQPGPWGRLALVESRLDPRVGAALSARAMSAGLRTLLIRRAAGTGKPQPDAPRQWAVVHSSPGTESTRWGSFRDDAELLDLPLDGTAGTPREQPTYLVCTHGRHDACCAMRGRPIAALLSQDARRDVWECTHVGGDRFAANLLVLPHGLYYGRVDEAAAREIVACYQRGEVALPWLRGRSAFAPPAQAAQQLARLQLGEKRLDALNPRYAEALGDGRWRVRLAHEPDDLVITVETAASGPTSLLTCAASSPAHPPTYRVVNKHVVR